MNPLFLHFKDINKKYNPTLTFEQKCFASRQLNRLINKRVFSGGKLNSNAVLNNCKSRVTEFTVKGEIITACVRKIRDESSIEYYFLNFHSTSTNCAILQIDTINKTCQLTDLIKQRGCLLKTFGDKFKDDFDKMGTFIINIVMKICKHLKISQLQILDDSYVNCGNKKDGYFRINLVISRMLIDGDTYYEKFGFVPTDAQNKKKIRK